MGRRRKCREEHPLTAGILRVKVFIENCWKRLGVELMETINAPSSPAGRIKLSSLSPPVCRSRSLGRYTALVRNPSPPSNLDLARGNRSEVYLLCIAAAATLLVGGGGCQKALLSPNDERSQYDRYDSIRGDRAPAQIEDAFGYRKPNLRGRLLAKD